MPDRAGDGHLAGRRRRPPRRLGPEDDRVDGGRQHPAGRRVEAHQAASSSTAATKSPVVAGSPASSRLPRAWPSRSLPREPVLEARRPAAAPSVVGHGLEAAAEVAGGGHAERAAQPAGRPAVVGGRDDGGDVRRRSGGRRAGVAARPWPPPTATTRGPSGAPASLVDVPVDDADAVAVGAAGGVATSSAMATERWRPPVQPRAMVR